MCLQTNDNLETEEEHMTRPPVPHKYFDIFDPLQAVVRPEKWLVDILDCCDIQCLERKIRYQPVGVVYCRHDGGFSLS